MIDVWYWLIVDSFSVVFAKFDCEVFLFYGVKESANFRFVATQFVARYPFVLIRVIKTLDSRMTFIALQTFWTLVPTNAFSQHEAVFWRILENFGWSSEISHVVGVNATFAVVTFFLRGTPSSFVHEHIEHESIFVQVQLLQVVVKVGTLHKTFRYEVVFDGFVLEV